MVSDDGIILALVGMGEVYREHDTNLSREVAIEVLLAAQAQGRPPGFERRAMVLAAMDHPDIAIIHGLKITATNARATNEEEAYEAKPMDSLGARRRSRDPS
jgi:hypothetical protein